MTNSKITKTTKTAETVKTAKTAETVPSQVRQSIKKMQAVIADAGAQYYSASQDLKMQMFTGLKEKGLKDDDLANLSQVNTYGKGGSAVYTKARETFSYSGWSEQAFDVFKLFNAPIEKIVAPKEKGGLVREKSHYMTSIVEMISQSRLHDSLDMTGINSALNSIDPTFKKFSKGKSTITYLLAEIKYQQHKGNKVFTWTRKDWDVRRNGTTQGSNLYNFFADFGMGTVSGQNMDTRLTVNMDHPIVKKLIELANKFTCEQIDQAMPDKTKHCL